MYTLVDEGRSSICLERALRFSFFFWHSLATSPVSSPDPFYRTKSIYASLAIETK